MQSLRFAIVGVLSLACDLGVFYVLIRASVFSPLAGTVAFVGSIAVNYVGHAVFTFGTGIDAVSIVRYLTLLAVQYLMTVTIIYSFDVAFGMPLTGKLISLAPVMLVGFFIGRAYVFRKRTSDKE